jgi:cytochrome c oxidase subunit II
MRFPKFRPLTLAGLVVGAFALSAGAFANPVGQPGFGDIHLQVPATELGRDINSFHNFLLVIITGITLFVTLLLLWVMLRYNRRANPVPKKFTHNTGLEIAWTLIPVIILVLIAWRSFPILYEHDVVPDVAESEIVDVKVYGRQWYWSYIYGSGDNTVEFDSNMVPDDMLKAGQLKQLSVDNPMVVPVGKTIRLSISASDVIHSWAMPAFMVKMDAVPGRLNQSWFRVDEPGVFYGQCSELCGRRHAYMPIEVRALPQAQYDRWLELAATSVTEARAYLDQVQPLTSTQVASLQQR